MNQVKIRVHQNTIKPILIREEFFIPCTKQFVSIAIFYTLFQTKIPVIKHPVMFWTGWSENHTLNSGSYPYRQYMGVILGYVGRTVYFSVAGMQFKEQVDKVQKLFTDLNINNNK